MIAPIARTRRRRTTSHGFTLVELLVVIVILGILSAVVVFAVRGSGGKGRQEASTTDDRILRTALETYCAKNGKYPADPDGTGPKDSMDVLVDGKFLSSRSVYNDLRVSSGERCGGTTYLIEPKDPPVDQGQQPGLHQPVEPEAACGEANGWCEDAATPGGTPQWGSILQSMVQLPNGKVFAVYQDADATCVSSSSCTFVGKSGLYDPTAAPGQRWTPGPTVTSPSKYTLLSLLVIEGTTPGQCGPRCGQVLADLGGTFDSTRWKLYNPTDNTWTATPPDIIQGSGSVRAVQLTGSETQCGDRCGQVLVVGADGRSEFYDPEFNTWTPGPLLDGIERDPVLALLQDGRVLVVSYGSGRSVAKLVDPSQSPDRMVSDAASPTGSYDPLGTIPARLPDGRILLTFDIAEIYSPEPKPGSGSWVEAESCGDADYCQVLAQLSDGRVLARASGNFQRNQGSPFATFLFYPIDGHWHPTGTPNGQAADGIGVFIAGGTGRACGDSCNKVLTVGKASSVAEPTAELYTPPPI
ncbi:MAG TPA: prepilin-type N-terminal cleavage/methylation domain-containing protein [Acidimicrobiales bacterium]|nr:prepilin-type N-terminal cleavage/methylation domain-containing protein [Acidimicrobiales bacterium]